MINKRNRYFIILLLLLIVAVGIFWCTNRKQSITPLPANFTITDSALYISGDQLVIKIWDYSAVDGDTVNILFDGKRIFEMLAIQDTPVVYQANRLVKGEHWLGVEAVNEGSNAPATPHISIDNGTASHEFDIESFIGKPAARKIIVQ